MDLITVFYQAFSGIWDILDTTLHFPQPIGDTSLFNLLAFNSIGFMLAELIMHISARRAPDND